MQYSTHGKIAVLWKPGELPELTERRLKHYYDDVYRPALEKDVRRLYEVYEESIRSYDNIDFGDYANGLINFKKDIGHMVLPNLKEADRKFDEAHAMFMTKDLINIDRRVQGITSDFEMDTPKLCEKRRLTAMFNCASFNTSDAVEDFTERLLSQTYQADLYHAVLRGRGEVMDLLTQEWPDQRRSKDTEDLRHRLEICITVSKFGERVQGCQQQISARERPKARVLALCVAS